MQKNSSKKRKIFHGRIIRGITTYSVRSVVTHHHPHMDEILAYILLVLFGQKYFPGVQKARINLVDAGSRVGAPMHLWADRGILPLGVGRGDFDDHNNRERQKSCSMIVAEFLQVANDFDVSHIISFVNRVDTRGKDRRENITSILQSAYLLNTYSQEEIIQWAIDGMEAKIGDTKKRKNFSVHYIRDLIAEQESEEAAEKWHTIATSALLYNTTLFDKGLDKMRAVQSKRVKHKGRNQNIFWVKSDNPLIGKAAFSSNLHKEGFRVGVLIVEKSDGHVSVFANQRYDIDLSDVVAILRTREQEVGMQGLKSKERKERLKYFIQNYHKLRSVGELRGIPWYYEKHWILNAALSSPGTPATKLTAEEVFDAVEVGLSDYKYPYKFVAKCRSWKCESSPQNKCPYFRFKLGRCLKIRKEKTPPKPKVAIGNQIQKTEPSLKGVVGCALEQAAQC